MGSNREKSNIATTIFIDGSNNIFADCSDLSQSSTSFQPINDTFNFQFLEEDEGALSRILIASGVGTI